PSPINCQRLPGGQTFVVTTNRVLVVDRQGNELVKVDRYTSIMAGQRLRDGRVIVMQSGGQLGRPDAAGQELGPVTRRTMNNYGGLEALPGGRFLIALYDKGRVLEYDLDGNLLWRKDTRSPNFATRLPNGNTLIGSQDAQSLVEVDRGGKQVWEYKPGKG